MRTREAEAREAETPERSRRASEATRAAPASKPNRERSEARGKPPPTKWEAPDSPAAGGGSKPEFTSGAAGGSLPPKKKKRGPPGEAWRAEWTRLQPIRTVSEIEVEFAIFTSEPFEFQRIGAEAIRMRRLGMSLRAIGRAFGVDEKTVRNALAREKDAPR